MITCCICNIKIQSLFKLSYHIRYCHKKSVKEYYDTYLKKNNEGMCKFCNGATVYKNISDGYPKSCKKCSHLRAKEFMEEFKKTDKFHINRTIVSKKQKENAEHRKKTGVDKLIGNKIRDSLNTYYKTITDDERKKKYGWMSKLSSKEKEIYINKFKLGIDTEHQSVIRDQLTSIHNLQLKKILINENKLIEIFDNNISNRKNYYNAVRYITKWSYRVNIDYIDPDRIRSKNWPLDHIFSIDVGFILKINPKIIGHWKNLRIISNYENSSKRFRCDIELKTLIDNIQSSLGNKR